jgi:GT2 family glycosyltransferase
VDVRWIEPDAAIAANRGDVVVCIPVYGGHEHFVACLRGVLAHTPADVPVLICDDASPDRRSQELVHKLEEAESGEHLVLYLRREHNLGFPANVNGAFAIAAPADVVVLNSDCVVGEGWLDGLREAAYVDSRVATATALTNHGSVVSVPDRGKPAPQLPPEWSLDAATGIVRERSLRLRPRLPTAIGHCMYIRRTALELVGDFDLAFTPGYGEEVDFSQRCVRSGLCHVLADDVLVLHYGGGSFSRNGKRNPVQDQHENMLQARYPYYHDSIDLVEEDVAGPLARALRRAVL